MANAWENTTAFNVKSWEHAQQLRVICEESDKRIGDWAVVFATNNGRPKLALIALGKLVGQLKSASVWINRAELKKKWHVG